MKELEIEVIVGTGKDDYKSKIENFNAYNDVNKLISMTTVIDSRGYIVTTIAYTK